MTDEAGRTQGSGGCIGCQATEAIRRTWSAFGPSEEAREHFRQSRVEFLKGIRRVIDDRIEKVSHGPQHKGSKIVVE